MIGLAGGCKGPQSALDPAGRGAQEIAELFWWMVGGAGLIWVLVIGLSFYAIRLKRRSHSPRKALFFIVGGGALLPTVVLTGLLAFGLSMLPELVAPAPEGSLTIEVSGEQWWWRVHYRLANGETVELANEIRLPVGQPVNFLLSSPDVVHAFWIPALGPKRDMVPGRINRLALYPTRTGTFRGVCAEYCGTSHAFMAFDVVVMEQAAFDQWLQGQVKAATMPPEASLAELGHREFLRSGCGACHTVRGTPADGRRGPDLTHVGSRLAIGASLLPNDREGIAQFIASTDAVKPDVHMPSFGVLPSNEVEALAAYLDSLE